MGTTTLDGETILSPPTLPATRCGIVGSGTREDEEDEEDEEEEIERDKPGEGGDEHGDDDEEDEEDDEEDEGGADYSRSYVPSGDGSRAVPGALGEP
jgi:hypothetical protein